MRKKFLAVALSCSMVFSLAACGSNNANNASSDDVETSADASGDTAEAVEFEKPEETVTLNVYTQTANYSGEQIGWFAQVMLEKFNVKLNIIPNAEGVFQTRMENGDLGDIIVFGGDMDQYTQAVEKEMLFDWNDEDLLATYGSYIQENMAQALEHNASISGGTTYGYGYDVATSSKDIKAFDYHPDLRYDLYKEIGSPEIKTLEDYVDVLDKMVEACPKSDSGKQTYGVSLFPDWDGDMVMFVKATAALYGWDEFGFGLYNVNTQEYQDCLAEGSMYLRCLKFYNDLYQRGLLDPDSSTQTFDNVTEDYTDGVAFFNIFAWMGAMSYNTAEHLAEGKYMAALPAEDSQPLVYGCNIYGNDRIWAIGANTEYPELCMAIINWLSTPEGCMTYNYGPKDVCWYYDENGKTMFTELGRNCHKDTNTELTDGYSGTFKDGSFQMNNTTWSLDATNPDSNGETFNDEKWESELNSEVTEIQQDWRDFTGYANANEYLASRPYSLALGTEFTRSAKDDELQIIWNQVATCIKEYSWKAIYAKDDAEYDKIVTEMREKAEGYGYAQCVEFQQGEAEIRKAAEDAVKALN